MSKPKYSIGDEVVFINDDEFLQKECNCKIGDILKIRNVRQHEHLGHWIYDVNFFLPLLEEDIISVEIYNSPLYKALSEE